MADRFLTTCCGSCINLLCVEEFSGSDSMSGACRLRVIASKAPGLGQPAAMSDVEPSSESSSSSNEANGPEYAEACVTSSSGEEWLPLPGRARMPQRNWQT